MSRSIFAALVVLFVAASAGLVWHFAYRAPARPQTVPVDSLSGPVTLGWSDGGAVSVRAETNADVGTALGYAHGMNRAWPAVLWRQTALGQLARWFGDGLVSMDAHVRALGLARGARRAYDELPDASRSLLEAYARGMNAALQSRRVRHTSEFVLLPPDPAPWKPWHTLAVERLFAWLGTSRLSMPAGAPAALDTFVTEDARLRRWLHLHGFDRSIAWTAAAPQSRDSTGRVLMHRFVTGASALPVVQEITIRRPSRPPLVVSTIPGSPIALSGTVDGRAWTLLPTSTAHLARRRVDSSAVTRRRARIETSSGREVLVTTSRTDRSLLFPHTSRAPSDSTWLLTWPGLHGATDVSAWLSLLTSGTGPSAAPTAAFTLFSGTGIEVERSGQWSVLGAPHVAEPVPDGVLVGPSPWARDQAESLRALIRSASPPRPAPWSVSDSSTWAARTLPDVLPALDPLSRASAPPLLRDALTYLRNWDAAFDRSSIGGTLFEEWMRAYRRTTGVLPTATDTRFFAPYRRQQAFVQAVQTLSAAYGPDLRRWRWENVAPHRRFFPVWSADSLVEDDLSDMATTQFAPLVRFGAGHPSALAGGPSRADPTWPAPSPGAWTGWTNPGRTTLTVRRLRFDPSTFMARPLMPGTRPPAVRLADQTVESTTTLVPP